MNFHLSNISTRDILRQIDYFRWQFPRKGITPYLHKVQIISNSSKSGRTTLIETGTNHGDMIRSQLHSFTEIYSIEFDDDLYESALEQFKYNSHVHLYHGDSGSVLPQVLQNISNSCVFWLDAHPSEEQSGKDVPIMAELMAILAHPIQGHRILVDDVRMFKGTRNWPSISDLISLLADSNRIQQISIESDILIVNLK